MIEKMKYQAYANATQTVARTRQIVLLYDGVIRFVQQAKEAITEKRIEDRYHLLIKASEVIGGLQGCLDFDNGGTIARILYNYYASIDMRLFTIHRTNSLETCDEIITDLKQMRDTWDEIDQGIASSAQAEPAAPSASEDAMLPPIQPENITLSA
jgi:flagellar protein FliS